jgi:CRP-like cAMP-binding protein
MLLAKQEHLVSTLTHSPFAFAADSPDIHITIRKLEALGNLSADERNAFLGLLEKPQRVAAGRDIVADGSSPTDSSCLISGFACRYKLFAGGRRQIMSLQLPGDITDVHSYVLKKMDHAVGALTECTVAKMPHEKVRRVTERFPNLAYLMWRETLVESATSRLWLAGVGRKSALSRVAHFFCEQFLRMEAVGLTNGNAAALGITQTDLADCLGLSLVHTNRVLQELRAKGLILLKSKTLTILDWKELKRLGEFDPAYLHFRRT